MTTWWKLTETFVASLALDASTPLIGHSKDLTDAATGTIIDNDTAIFSIDDATVNEAAGTLTFYRFTFECHRYGRQGERQLRRRHSDRWRHRLRLGERSTYV